MKALEAGDRLAAEALERAEKATADRTYIALRLAVIEKDVPALCAEVERRGRAIRHIRICGHCYSLLAHEQFCPIAVAILAGEEEPRG